MNIKRSLIETLPPSVKRLLSVPYDFYQTQRADRQFRMKKLPDNQPVENAPQHIVCVVVDALRADHIDDKTTPFLSHLNGTDAITPGTWTFPAMSSFISGVYPHEHGASIERAGTSESDQFTLPPRMDDGRTTLTELLAGAGYETYGGFGHDTPFVAIAGRFHTHTLFHKVNSKAEDVFDAYLNWVDGRNQTFALLHLADPHIPVEPPEQYWKKHSVDRSIENIKNWNFKTEPDCDETCQQYRANRRRLYRAAVDHVDDATERFVNKLESTVEDPLIIVTSDHGEAMWEHVETDVELFNGTGCVDHGGTPYEQVARVPLLTNADWLLEGDISLIDIAPTLLDAVGIDGIEMSGYSLYDKIPESRKPIVEGCRNGSEKKAIYNGQSKLVVSKEQDVTLGYRLPKEQRVELPADVYDTLVDSLPSWPKGETAHTEVSDVVEDRLGQLGYK
ncbi:sulfatase-like hydrolase/transferase [Halonotius pteroides]|uniref:Sulfatase n=1 Tax=Halonotius pteroides TaxID=268735 RepID=A0A3A6PWY7_9EURY|nr:sulfatase-like hydrolase/transferase [Halonotius pteroides]RJX47506.1 sulfatase [Halonotius pteroides]